MEKNCLFCKIVKKEIPSNIVYENDKVIAFLDINPKAPVHILIIPKEHVKSLNEVENFDIFSYMLEAAKEIAVTEGISEKGYRLIMNTGKDGGQLVDHMHIHLLGGKHLGSKIVE